MSSNDNNELLQDTKRAIDEARRAIDVAQQSGPAPFLPNKGDFHIAISAIEHLQATLKILHHHTKCAEELEKKATDNNKQAMFLAMEAAVKKAMHSQGIRKTTSAHPAACHATPSPFPHGAGGATSAYPAAPHLTASTLPDGAGAAASAYPAVTYTKVTPKSELVESAFRGAHASGSTGAATHSEAATTSTGEAARQGAATDSTAATALSGSATIYTGAATPSGAVEVLSLVDSD
ncbi:unnamed protein product [Ectocarpus sp. 6 AP-2014]